MKRHVSKYTTDAPPKIMYSVCGGVHVVQRIVKFQIWNFFFNFFFVFVNMRPCGGKSFKGHIP